MINIRSDNRMNFIINDMPDFDESSSEFHKWRLVSLHQIKIDQCWQMLQSLEMLNTKKWCCDSDTECLAVAIGITYSIQPVHVKSYRQPFSRNIHKDLHWKNSPLAIEPRWRSGAGGLRGKTRRPPGSQRKPQLSSRTWVRENSWGLRCEPEGFRV